MKKGRKKTVDHKEAGGHWFASLPPRYRAGLPYLVLSLAVLAAYANVYQFDFVWDDLKLLTMNERMSSWSYFPDLFTKTTYACFYRPVLALLYFLIYQAVGPSEATFHGLNVLLQMANVSLFYLLGCRLGFYRRASFVTALLWGVHPLWSGSVAYAAGIADLLVFFFFALGLLNLLPDFAPRKMWKAALFFLLALGSKESAIVFPALVSACLFLISKDRLRFSTYIRTWPLWLMTSVYITGWLLCPELNNLEVYNVRADAFYAMYTHNFPNRLLTSLASLPLYLRIIFWPEGLHLDWNHFLIHTELWAADVWAGIVIVALALSQIIWGRGKRGVPLTWGLLWFAAALSPDTGILKATDALFSQSWIYLPTVGLSLAVAQTSVDYLDRLRMRRALECAAGVVGLLAVALGIITYTQNEAFRTPVTFFERVVKYNPESPWAHWQLGLFYYEAGDYKKSAGQWRQVEAANSYSGLSDQDVSIMHVTIALDYLNIIPVGDKVPREQVVQALSSCKHIPEVIAELEKAHELTPHVAYINYFLADIYDYLGDKKNAAHYHSLE